MNQFKQSNEPLTFKSKSRPSCADYATAIEHHKPITDPDHLVMVWCGAIAFVVLVLWLNGVIT